jgi:AraC-like DNA-binding protein
MQSDQPGGFYFSTDGLPERDRFPAFCEGMFRNVIRADIEKQGPEPFTGALDIHRLGVVGIADISITAATVVRHAGYISDGNDAIVAQFWRRGSAFMTQGKHESSVSVGESLTIDNVKPARFWAEGSSRFWALTIPRDSLTAASPEAVRAVGAKLTNRTALRLLFGYLREIALKSFVDATSAHVYGNHIVDLVALALGGESVAEARGLRAARQSAILQEIERNSSNPALNAKRIAAELGITPRYVHLLLEETGRSFQEHVLTKRLEMSEALLRDPLRHKSKISEIAAEAGFADLSYFNRVFRRHFGATPSDIREAARRHPVSPSGS